jgi:hypothetical protein
MASVNGLQSIKSYRLTGTVTRGRLVKADGVSGGIAAAAQATGAGVYLLGVALTSGVAGDIIDVQLLGNCPFAIASGVLTPGIFVTSDANGKLVAAASGDRIVGIILSGATDTGATDDGVVCELNLQHSIFP